METEPPRRSAEEIESNSDKKVATPLPWKTMAILVTVILSEPISLTILFPFIYFMVKDFGYVEKDVGFYVGFIASSFSLAQFLTSMQWGRLSDSIGRRPVLLIGLIGNSISTCLFGLSRTLIWAICSRSLCGLLNGNIGVAKSVLGEITDSSNQGAAFSLIGLNYGIGLIIGPMLGGLLSHPVENYPYLFQGNQFLTKYPYFLPCFFSSLISTIGVIMGYFLLPETCSTLLAEKGYQALPENDAEILESRPVLDCDDDECDLIRRDTTALEIPEPDLFCRRDLAQDEQELLCGGDHAQDPDQGGIGYPAIASSVSYALLAFQSIVFTEVFPLWAVSKPNVGLGFQAKDIGLLFSILGLIAITVQLFIYPRASRRFGPVLLFKMPLILLAVVFGALPLISTYLAASPALKGYVFPALLFLMSIRTLLENFIFTSVMLLVNNSAKPGQLGFVNGIAQSSASFARAIGPALGGSIWSWSGQNGYSFPFNHVFIFLFIILLILILVVQAFTMLGDDLNERKTK